MRGGTERRALATQVGDQLIPESLDGAAAHVQEPAARQVVAPDASFHHPAHQSSACWHQEGGCRQPGRYTAKSSLHAAVCIGIVLSAAGTVINIQ